MAYKFVAILLMLMEVNHYNDALKLKMPHPVTVGDIMPTSNVSAPELAGFSGSIVTESYFFGFIEGRLRYVHRRPSALSPRGNGSMVSTPRADIVRTNSAYRLALSMLAGLGIDTDELEKLHSPSVTYVEPAIPSEDTDPNRWPQSKEATVDITWGQIQVHPRRSYRIPAVSISFSAEREELLKLRIEGPAQFWKRNDLHINALDDLRGISDEQFIAKSFSEKKRLFVHHTGVGFPTNLLGGIGKIPWLRGEGELREGPR